jgi:Acidobacterial duplicated orphan permease
VKRRDKILESLGQEIRDHVELETQDNMVRGMSPADARRAALLKFGNPRLIAEDTRAVWRHLWLDELVQDLRFGLRMLFKTPGFTLVAVLTLALGIGANTAIFSLLNAVMLQSIPVDDPRQLVVLRWSARGHPQNSGSSSFGDCSRSEWSRSFATSCSFTYAVFQEIRNRRDLFSGVSAFAGPAQLNLAGNGTATMVSGELVSGDYFQTLGVPAALGRTLQAEDEKPGAEAVVALSYAYWQGAFGGNRSVIGKSITLNGVPFTIVGVADPRFTRLVPGKSPDLWVSLSEVNALRIPWNNPERYNSWWLTIVVRLAPGASLPQAQLAVSILFRNEVLHEALLKPADDPEVTLLPAERGLVGMRGDTEQPLFVLMAAVGILLLISCANVAGLMLSRASTRQKEMAVRLALGAGRGRVTRQLLTESVMLSLAGAAIGIPIAYWGANALAAFVAANRYSSLYLNANPDLTVLAFTLGVALLTGVLFGLAPALRGTSVNLAPMLKENAASAAARVPGKSHKFAVGNLLVVAQVTLSVIVLVGAGLVVRSLANLKGVDPGFDTRNILQFGVDPTLTGYYREDQIRPLYRELQTRLSALPGVLSVSYSSGTLLDGSLWTSDVKVQGRTDKATVETQMLSVGPDFFTTMRIPAVTGRLLNQADVESTHEVALVNMAFVKKFLENRDPLGLHLGGDNPQDPQYEIIGVVGDTKYSDLRLAVEPTAFIPVKKGGVNFAIRTASDPLALLPAARRIVADLDNNLPLFDVRTQTDRIERLLFNERLIARLAGLFGLLALVLACLGLYGLLAYEVAQRTREIGIRTALGAQKRDVLRLVGAQGLALVVSGIAFGVVAALLITRFLGSLLYQVRPADPITLLAVCTLFLLVGVLACWIPARRAALVDPMSALRCE